MPKYDLDKFLEDITVPKTRAAYRTGATAFLEFLGDRPLDNETLIGFWRWLRRRKPQGQWHKDSKNLSESSIKAYLAAANAFILFLIDEGKTPKGFSLDMARRKLQRVAESKRAPYSTEDVSDKLPEVVLYYDRLPLPTGNTSKAQHDRLILLRDRAVMHVLYSTAARIHEVAQLSRTDVKDGTADTASIMGKGSLKRLLFFTAEAKQAMAAYLQERSDADQALFVGHRRTGRIGTHALWQIVTKAAESEGVKVHPHSFRHFRAQQLLHEGMDIDVLQTYLGHADIGTTRKIYAPNTDSGKVLDQLQTFGRSPADLVK